MAVERIQITEDYTISRIIKGGWHLAGGHGNISEEAAVEDMKQFVEAGITTFDCADIYTGVENMIGKFLEKYKDAFAAKELPSVQIHTKYVPDYNALKDLRAEDTTKVIDRSLKRLGVERLDLVQYAWWDYRFPRYVETAVHLSELQKQGKIRHIGVTNFDGKRLKEILDAGVKVVTNQVQYSVLDQRVEEDSNHVMQAHNISYLCYGVIAGGFLSDRYLNQADPVQPLENRSLTKYRLIIDEFGGYELFQELLKTMSKIAQNYEVGIAEIASRFILQKDHVAACIIGARNTNHLDKIKKVGSFRLTTEDISQIQKVIDLSDGPIGPFYELERDKTGKHGSIMKYNLNAE